jgi:flagellar hook-associated protein 3 FlgL
MRVTFNSTYSGAIDTLAGAAEEMVRRQTQVSTGLKYGSIGENASAAAAAVREKSYLASSDQYLKSGDSATSRLAIIDSVLSTVIDEVTSAISVAQSGMGSSVTDEGRASAAEAVLALRDSILSAINTKYLGTYIFSGSDSTAEPYTTDAGGNISAYQGSTGTIDIEIDTATSVTVVCDASTILAADDGTDLFTTLTNLAAAIGAGDSTAITTGVSALNETFDRINLAQSHVGNDMTLVETHAGQLESLKLASQTRLAAIQDVDMAEAATGMTQADNAYKAALASISATSQLSLFDYLT